MGKKKRYQYRKHQRHTPWHWRDNIIVEEMLYGRGIEIPLFSWRPSLAAMEKGASHLTVELEVEGGYVWWAAEV